MPIRNSQIARPGPFRNLPIYKFSNGTSTNSNVFSLDVQPPVGRTWALLFARAGVDSYSGAGTDAVHTLDIRLVDRVSGANFILGRTIGQTLNSVPGVTFASGTNGPIVLSNDYYLRLNYTCTSGAQTGTSSLIVALENI